MIEKEIIHVLRFELTAHSYELNFHKTLFECIQHDLENMSKYIHILFKEKRLTKDTFLYILYLENEITHIHYIFSILYKISLYSIKKNKLYNKRIVYFDDYKNSIIDTLADAVSIMIYVSQNVPMKKNVELLTTKALLLLKEFDQHGHHISNVSNRKTFHSVRELLYYIRYFNKIYYQIYQYGIESVFRNINYGSIVNNLENI